MPGRRTALLMLAVAAIALPTCGAAKAPSGDPIPREADSGPAWQPGQRALGAALDVPATRDDERYRRTFLDTFDSVTAENAMKWNALQPERGEWTFGAADALVDWARASGKRVRGHTLVWDQQLPAWVADADWSKAELEQVLRDHVTRAVRHYRGRVESWDVVNEPFEDDGSWTPNVFYRALGSRYVEIAFRAARAADPGARLFLNEIAAEREGAKRSALLGLVADLKRRGVPIDGVGFQNHTVAGHGPTRAQLVDTLGRAQALGLDSEITEMDVVTGPNDPASRQPQNYADAAAACSALPRCTGLTVWGVDDRRSWLGAERTPLLFDVDGRPKPALAALRTNWRADRR